MRINGVNDSPYAYQVALQKPSESDAESAKTSEGEVCVRLELSGAMPPLKENKTAEKPDSQNTGKWLQKEWKSLQEWAKETAKKARELWKKLAEKAVEMATKFGNLWQQEKRPLENGVPQVTWQENFRRRVKILFDAVAGFLSGHLPMGNGNFSETKEEKKEEELTGKNNSEEKKKENRESTFDVKG